MVGTVESIDLFRPTFAVIVKNMDELRIALELDPIASAKEFKKSISSISPEMQRFSQLYRGI
jgi:hypothetical protein